jgi:hypothetical protein
LLLGPDLYNSIDILNMHKYNPHQKSIFNKLEPIPDTSFHAPLVNKVRDSLQEQTTIADDENSSDGSDEEGEE